MPNLFQTHCYIFSQQKLSGTQPHVQTLRIPLPILKFPTSTLTFHLRPSSWSLHQEDDIPRVVLVAWIWRVNTLASSCLREYLSMLTLSATVPRCDWTPLAIRGNLFHNPSFTGFLLSRLTAHFASTAFWEDLPIRYCTESLVSASASGKTQTETITLLLSEKHAVILKLLAVDFLKVLDYGFIIHSKCTNYAYAGQ